MTTETERQRLEMERWATVRGEVHDAWCEQLAETSPLQWGLIYHYVQAILAKAAWTEYRYLRGLWLADPNSHDDLKAWRGLPESERGPEPGPPQPRLEEPDDRDLPVLTPDTYGRNHGPDSDARIYLAACRLRAGLEVEPRYVEPARARYPWARHSREVA